MNPAPERIETARLKLRRPTLDDAQAIFEEYASDPEATRFLVFTPHKKVETVRVFLRDLMERMARGDCYAFAITLPASDRLIGMLEIRIQGPRAEFGYVLGKPYWGKGYMAEALRPVLDWALAQPEIYRVWAFCDVENKGSARVLEKVGLKREGILRKWFVHPNISDVPRDCYCYAVVKE